jgi:hypothetical protein
VPKADIRTAADFLFDHLVGGDEQLIRALALRQSLLDMSLIIEPLPKPE